MICKLQTLVHMNMIHHMPLSFLPLWAIVSAPAWPSRGGGGLVAAFDPSGNNAYASWVAHQKLSYEHSFFLPSFDDDDDVAVAMHWSIDISHNSIRIAVAAEATGWLGFGLAEAGGMPGADIVVFTASDGSLTDFYATAYDRPHEDSCQDWTLVNSSTADGFIIWEATRRLNTGDNQDRPILDDSLPEMPSTTIIAAHGNDYDLGFHGKNRFKGKVRFLSKVSDASEQFLRDMAAEGATSKDIKVSPTYVIPSKPTTLKRFCTTASAMGITDKVHAIGFFPIVQNPEHVHHMVLWASESEDIPCHKLLMEPMIQEWARGMLPAALPAAAGYPFGGADGLKSFLVEVHYDNPHRKHGIQDSSGFRIYFADKLRWYDAAMWRIADPFVSLGGTGIQSGLTSHVFDCPSACTKDHFEANEVTIFQEKLHAHQKAARITNQLIRSGAMIHEGVAEYFDNAQSGSLILRQQPFVVQKGDTFRTTCYYNTTGNTSFGVSTSDEMCIVHLSYYPKQPIPMGVCMYRHVSHRRSRSCTASYNWTSIDEAELGRSFGVDSGQCVSTDLSSAKATLKPVSLFSLVMAAALVAMLVSLVAYHTYQKKHVLHYVQLFKEEEASHPTIT